MKELTFFPSLAEIEFTMTSFKRYYRNHENIVNTFFSLCPYARTSRKLQHIRNIVFVDKLNVVGNMFKTFTLTNPCNGEDNCIQFFQKGNNFEYISSWRYLFFLKQFLKINEFAQWSNFLSRGKKVENIVSKQDICVARTGFVKKV